MMDIIEYLEDKAQKIIDASNVDDAYSEYTQLYGIVKALVECDLYKDDAQLQKADDIFMQSGHFMSDNWSK